MNKRKNEHYEYPCELINLLINY